MARELQERQTLAAEVSGVMHRLGAAISKALG